GCQVWVKTSLKREGNKRETFLELKAQNKGYGSVFRFPSLAREGIGEGRHGDPSLPTVASLC
ncbi:MAG: hypothetical protein ACOCY5_02790, partial [Desulfohalobiaceae bacterium]